jgi:hypothetical protein
VGGTSSSKIGFNPVITTTFESLTESGMSHGCIQYVQIQEIQRKGKSSRLITIQDVEIPLVLLLSTGFGPIEGGARVV